MEKTRILIVDNHPVVRLGLRLLIDQTFDMCVCGEAADAATSLELVASRNPDILITEINLSRGMDGIELLKAIRREKPGLAVLILSTQDESCYAERLLRAGANGYVMKAEAPETILFGIRQIINEGHYVSQPMARQILQTFVGGTAIDRPKIDTLTDRELQVLELIGRGHGTRQIAEDLHLSVKTIETYYAHLKDKLSLKNSRQLVQNAVEWWLFEAKGQDSQYPSSGLSQAGKAAPGSLRAVQANHYS